MKCARLIAEDRRFQAAVLAVIVANAVLIGVETFPTLRPLRPALLTRAHSIPKTGYPAASVGRKAG